MTSYIGVTSREWFTYLINCYISKEDTINFWKKSTTELKKLNPGDDFYFLVKNPKNVKGEREILGKARYIRFELNNYKDAWQKYGNLNGSETIEEFKKRMNNIYRDGNISEFGSIILDNFEVFDQGFKPSELGINFANNVVSGRYLEEDEERLIKSKINKIQYTQLIYDFSEKYTEGKEFLGIHIKKERNPLVKKAVIQKFKSHNKAVFCEACGFNFYENYGELGKDYIECHHTKPIHQMNGETETRIEDMVLLCSNCHRMVHRNFPMLSVDELKEIIKNNSK